MSTVEKCDLPEESLLARYHKNGVYTDCYTVHLPRSICQEEYIAAFYTTWLFKIERFLLKLFVAKPSTDEDVFALAKARQTTFAAWTVESRNENQLLMSDYQGRTRSWLMTEQHKGEGGFYSQLYFGSAVVPSKQRNSQHQSMGFIFNSLLGFHKIYSKALLYLAVKELNRNKSSL